MKKQPSPELVSAFAVIAEMLGGPHAAFHITMPFVCDCCRDENKEAFPYDAYAPSGRHWDVLCNDCFDMLGCRIDVDY